LSRWLLRPHETDFTSIFEEALHTGIVLIGLKAFVSFVFLLLQVFRSPEVLLAASAAGVAAICLVVFSRRLASYLHGVGRRPVDACAASMSIVSVGLVLVGLYQCLHSIIGGISAVTVLLAQRVEYGGALGEIARWFQMSGVYINAAGLALSCAVLLSAPRVAACLCGGENEVHDDRPPTAGPGARTYVELTLFAGLLYVFVDYFSRRMGPFFSEWRARDVIRVVGVSVAILALGMGVFYVGRLCLAKVARWLVPQDSENGEDNGTTPLVILEVAITIIAVHRVASDLLSVSSIVAEKALPEAAVISLGIILLRSDIAWLMLGRRRPSEAISAERRAAAVRPWLILLGVCLVVTYVAGAVAWLGMRPAYGSLADLPHLGFVAGLALIFAPGWFSRLLSHGRIIPRIWPNPRPVG
jgi:hypothetical protein